MWSESALLLDHVDVSRRGTGVYAAALHETNRSLREPSPCVVIVSSVNEHEFFGCCGTMEQRRTKWTTTLNDSNKKETMMDPLTTYMTIVQNDVVYCFR